LARCYHLREIILALLICLQLLSPPKAQAGPFLAMKILRTLHRVPARRLREPPLKPQAQRRRRGFGTAPPILEVLQDHLRVVETVYRWTRIRRVSSTQGHQEVTQMMNSTVTWSLPLNHMREILTLHLRHHHRHLEWAWERQIIGTNHP